MEMSLSPRERIEELEEENRQLRAMLEGRRAAYRGLEKLPGTELLVLHWLLTGGVWSAEHLLDMFQIKKVHHYATREAISVYICRLRKWLRGLDPPIQVFTNRGVGYYMDEANRALLRAREIT